MSKEGVILQARVSASAKAIPGEMATVGICPHPHIIEGDMDANGFALLRQWVELNRDTLVSYWKGEIDTQDALELLKKV